MCFLNAEALAVVTVRDVAMMTADIKDTVTSRISRQQADQGEVSLLKPHKRIKERRR